MRSFTFNEWRSELLGVWDYILWAGNISGPMDTKTRTVDMLFRSPECKEMA